MKHFLNLFVFAVYATFPLVDIVHGFSPSVLIQATLSSASSTTTRLYGLLDFKPFHGQGSGEGKSDLDSQWEVQQEILAARRGQIDKSALKKKYANGARGDLSSLGGGRSGGGGATASDRKDEMYVESPKKATSSRGGGRSKTKFFWEK
jgi:hypothetical protein